MFTGIVEEVGKVISLTDAQVQDGSFRLTVGAAKVLDGLRLGDSVSVNGACLTAVDITPDGFSVDLAPETLRRTNLGSLDEGMGLNLERALSFSDRLGGHVVQGHVDNRGRISSIKPEGDCILMRFRVPKRLSPYLVEKGFIAVDGISLTVVKRGATYFSVSLIPFTLDNTAFREKRVGDQVNLEVDILAKYVESLLKSGDR